MGYYYIRIQRGIRKVELEPAITEDVELQEATPIGGVVKFNQQKKVLKKAKVAIIESPLREYPDHLFPEIDKWGFRLPPLYELTDAEAKIVSKSLKELKKEKEIPYEMFEIKEYK